jgi:hypothetical protein
MTKNMGLFFTKGMSLAEWDRIGMLEREIAPYNLLADYFEKVFFFTYGGKKELRYKKHLKSNIKIIYNKYNMNNYLYSLLMPFLHEKIIKRCHILKTNQMVGAWTALIAKIINRKAKFVLRTGYTASLLENNMSGH